MEVIIKLIADYWLQLMVVSVTGLVLNLLKKYKATQFGVQALLRSQIIMIYNKYNAGGFMPIYEKENLEYLYKEYKILKGNGVVDGIYEHIIKLPTTGGVK